MTDQSSLYGTDYYYGSKLSNYAAYDQLDTLQRWKPILNVFKKYDISGSILDIGCAFGYFLKYAEPYFETIKGIDTSDFAIEKARKNVPNGSFQVLDLDKDDLPFPDGSFDVITAFDVLEHTQSISASIEKIAEKLKTGGHPLFSVPVKDTWAGRIFTVFDKDVTHISVPTKRELEIVVEKSGLDLVQRRHFFAPGDFQIPGIPVTHEILLRKPYQ
jgi:2-polyprenyl-3-methyl-5-hydroxy-6-metoxy-1,4-benzoquinol methylase